MFDLKNAWAEDLRKVDYTVSEDGTRVDKSEESVMIDALEKVVDRVQAVNRVAYVGALLASLFRELPFLASFKMELWAEFQLGDEGQYYRSLSVGVSDVELVDGVVVPEQFANDGVADEDLVGDAIQETLDDCLYDVYKVWVPEDSQCETITKAVARSSLATVLDEPVISGLAAFRLIDEDLFRHTIEEAERAVPSLAAPIRQDK